MQPIVQVRMTLRELLRAALASELPGGCVYHPEYGDLHLDTPCLLLEEDRDAVDEERDIPLTAVNQGFHVVALDAASVEDTAQWVRQFGDQPSDDLLLESYLYYLRYDAFLPSPGAPPPPPAAESKRRLQLELYDRLGPERSDVGCGKEGCGRGAVGQSVYCRVHHFEMVMNEPCPFSH